MRRNKEKARDYSLRHGVPKYYNSAEELLNDPEVNAIYIATPPAFHKNYALKAIKRGKPVYIEKPVTLNARECEELLRAEKECSVPVVVAHYRRRLPLFIKVKEILEQGIIGTVQLIGIRLLQSPEFSLVAKTDNNWRIQPKLSGGGLFHDLAPHQLDILCWLFGEPVSFQGFSYNQGKRYKAPDTTTLKAIFHESILLEGLWSFNVHNCSMEDRCEILGNKGKLSFSFFRDPRLMLSTDSGTQEFILPYPEHVQQSLIAEVVQCFRGCKPNPSPLEEALWSMKMMDATVEDRGGMVSITDDQK
jgi:predicted dehydrogenase